MSDMDEFNRKVIEEFRQNAGKVGGSFEGATMVLITTTGAKSGLSRTNPLVCLPGEDGTLWIFASKAGAPSDPDWFRNLLANPSVVVEFGTDRYEATATPLAGAERDAVYATQVERAPVFADYQEKAGRVIPVVALVRT